MNALSEQRLRDYREHGFLFPLRALTPQQAGACFADFERLERRLGSPLSRPEMRMWRSSTHVCLPWVDALIRNPVILDVAKDILGPDILVYTSTFFIKEPGTPAFTAWHQDATYFGLQPYEHFTAWLALTDASRQAGCMDVLSSHGAPRQLRHAAARLENSINGAGQVIVEALDDSDPVAMELSAGEFSLHHTLCPHRSAPNRAPHRRVGLGISYIPAHVRCTGRTRLYATLVRGTDRWGNFDLLPSPKEEMSEETLALHKRVHARYQENYIEQERRHEAEFDALPASLTMPQ